MVHDDNDDDDDQNDVDRGDHHKRFVNAISGGYKHFVSPVFIGNLTHIKTTDEDPLYP